MIKNERIYSKDIKEEYIAVFNLDGQFLHKIGGRGHAKNELIGNIYDFDIDKQTDDVHIYDREGHKILVLDRNGKFKRNIILQDCIPTSVKIAPNNCYLASCDISSLREYGPKLIKLNEDGEIVKSYIEDEKINKITFEGKNTIPLFSEDSNMITYLPLLSDSLVLLSDDSIKNVINLKFEDGFPSGPELDKIKESGKITHKSKKIQFISSAKVNDYYCLIHFYAYDPEYDAESLFTYLYDIKHKKSYCKERNRNNKRLTSCTNCQPLFFGKGHFSVLYSFLRSALPSENALPMVFPI